MIWLNEHAFHVCWRMEMVPQLRLPLKEFGQVRKQFHFPLRNPDSAAKSRIIDDTRLLKGYYYGGKLPIVSASMEDYGADRQLNLRSAEHGLLCG